MGPVHAPPPPQAMVQLLPPQLMRCPHAPAPVQVMAQVLAALQSMVDKHDVAPMQFTLQGIPGGQTIGKAQVPTAVHVTLHVPSGSHVPTPASRQRAGQAAFASTSCASLVTVPASASASDPIIIVWPPSPAFASPLAASSELSALPSSVSKLTSGNVHAAPATSPALTQEARTNAAKDRDWRFTNRKACSWESLTLGLAPTNTTPGSLASCLSQ
jgi:hypothetical protein